MFNDITLIGAVTESALTINLRVCLSCHRPGPPSPPNLDLCVRVQQRPSTRARVFRIVYTSRRFTDRLSNEISNIYNARIAVFCNYF